MLHCGNGNQKRDPCGHVKGDPQVGSVSPSVLFRHRAAHAAPTAESRPSPPTPTPRRRFRSQMHELRQVVGRGLSLAGGLLGQRPPLRRDCRQAQRFQVGGEMRGLGNRGRHQQGPSTNASYADSVGTGTAICASSGRTPVTGGHTGGGPACCCRRMSRTVSRRGEWRSSAAVTARSTAAAGCVSIKPQHPDPLLIGLARVPRELGPHVLPHRGQPPVEKSRRLGHRSMLAFQQRQHVKRIEDLGAPAEHRGDAARPPRRRPRSPPGRDRASPTCAVEKAPFLSGCEPRPATVAPAGSSRSGWWR